MLCYQAIQIILTANKGRHFRLKITRNRAFFFNPVVSET